MGKLPSLRLDAPKAIVDASPTDTIVAKNLRILKTTAC